MMAMADLFILFGKAIESIPFSISLYVVIGSLLENGGLPNLLVDY